ncbi:WD40 repeat domain-containing protein, partial [bacterium]|nr:WD40 repeat domain-containing protein [bacterium]
MIFDLAEDFAAALEAMPRKHRKRRTLRLLNEAIRRDIHFIDRHPTTLFQCMWNSCWWYDNPKTVYHYVEPKAGKAPRTPSCGFWQRKLYKRMKTWRKQKEKATRDFLWVESLRPPRAPLGGGQIRVLAGHSNSVTVLAYSPCGGHLVSASADGSAAVWDVRSGALTSRFPGHGERIIALAVSPDGRMAVTGVEGQAIRLWRCEDGAELPRLDDHSYNGGGVAWSRDGRYLACSADDNTIRLWNASDGRPLSPIPCGDGAAEHLAFSPDSRFLAFCQKGGDTVVQDVQDISRRHVMSTHERRVNCLAWGPHSLRLVISADDRTCIWDMRTGQSTLTLPDYSNVVSDLCFSPDGERLATAAWDETVRLWDTETGRQIACFEGHDDRVFAVAFSPDGTRLASGGVDNTVRIWDTEKPRGAPHLIGKPDVIG